MLPKEKKVKDKRKHNWDNWRKSEKQGGLKATKHVLSIYITEF